MKSTGIVRRIDDLGRVVIPIDATSIKALVGLLNKNIKAFELSNGEDK